MSKKVLQRYGFDGFNSKVGGSPLLLRPARFAHLQGLNTTQKAITVAKRVCTSRTCVGSILSRKARIGTVEEGRNRSDVPIFFLDVGHVCALLK